MFFKNFQMLFVTTLISGTFLAVSSNSWFISWLGLELNLLSLIPLILSKAEPKSTEASIKYFITQAFASILLIFFSLMIFYSSMYFNMQGMNSIILIALTIKSGMAPFHFWFPQVMILVDWFTAFLILVWQKIAPFILMSFFFEKYIILTLMIMSALVGGLGALNQTNIKLILTYSSIIHSSWMLMMVSMNVIYWMNYFLIYTLISLIVILHSNNMGANKISEIYENNYKQMSKIMFSMNIMSLGGLPPFMGFFAKLSAVIVSLKIIPAWVLMSMMMLSLVSLFYYMKLVYNFSMNYSPMKKINLLKNKKLINENQSFTNSLSITGNLLAPLLILLI